MAKKESPAPSIMLIAVAGVAAALTAVQMTVYTTGQPVFAIVPLPAPVLYGISVLAFVASAIAIGRNRRRFILSRRQTWAVTAVAVVFVTALVASMLIGHPAPLFACTPVALLGAIFAMPRSAQPAP